MYLFTSAAPNIKPPPIPTNWLAARWCNWGMKSALNLSGTPQGDGTAPSLLHDFEPEPAVGETWTVYDRGEDFARLAATVVTRNPGMRHLMYGPAAITGAQADPAKKAKEDEQLAKLRPAFFTMGLLGCVLAMDISLRAGQSVESWRYAMPFRLARLREIGAESGMDTALVLGVRRGGGGRYADTVAHTADELREMAQVARGAVLANPRTLVCVWAHYPSQTFADDGGRAYAVLAEAFSGLKPKGETPAPAAAAGKVVAKGAGKVTKTTKAPVR